MNKNNRNIFIVSIIAISIISITAYLLYIKSSKALLQEWNNKIYNGVTIGNIDVSGKSEQEAYNLVQDKLVNELNHKSIVLSMDDTIIRYEYKDFNVKYKIDEAVSEALRYGKNLSIHKQKKLIKSNSKKHEISLDMECDNDSISKVISNIKKEIEEEPQDAKINIVDNKIVIEKEKIGIKIDDSVLINDINNGLNSDMSEDTMVEVKTIEEEPSIKSENIAKIKNKMSSFSTDYSSSDYNRAYNVELATSLVNGTILMPDEVFSYSEVSQKGIGKYKDAPVYINNKVEQAEAGGICQVSTTLYRAVMKANIRSVERLNHSLPVGYAKLGLDATVAWGSIDYKFKNPYDFPIYIQGIADGGTVTFNVYGDVDALDGKTYNMENEIVETIEPSVSYIDDPELTVGTEVTDTYGNTGYKVKSYQITYENGVEINRELVATDNYAATETIIRRGTKVVENQSDSQNQVQQNNTQDQNNQNTNSTDQGAQDVNNIKNTLDSNDNKVITTP